MSRTSCCSRRPLALRAWIVEATALFDFEVGEGSGGGSDDGNDVDVDVDVDGSDEDGVVVVVRGDAATARLFVPLFRTEPGAEC